MAKKKEVSPVNNALLNMITPIGLKFKKNTLDIGESAARAYGVIKYPENPEYGWLSRLTNIPSTIVSIGFTPIDNGTFLNTLSNKIKQERGIADSAKDPLIASRAERTALHAEKTMLNIDGEEETVGLLNTVIMPLSRNEEGFSKQCKKVENIAIISKCKLRTLSNLQKEGFKQVSPFYIDDEDINGITQRIMPLSTFIGGFPFASSGFNDGSGYYFAKDSSGGLMIVDLWKRGGDRNNTNITFMGDSGVGKTTALKHIALAEYMKGTKIIFIDPHGDFREFTNKLEGDWIDSGGGIKGKINPLQIRTSPVDDEDEEEKLYKDEGNGIGDMALYIKSLEVFFKLYIPLLTDRLMAILKSEIIELYNNFEIYWDTDIKKLKNTDFPIMENLYNQINIKSNNKDNPYKRDYEDLSLLLKDIATGSDSFLYNGHTTISAKSRCICLDTKKLQNSPKNIITSQYYNMLQWSWEEATRDPNERVIIFADEAYLMMDPENPQSSAFLRNAAKGIRKFEGSIVVVSHSVVDFLDSKVKMYGQALLDLATYKIIMGTDGKNLQETKDLYNLTEAEEELIASKQRGKALMIIGSKRLKIDFDIPDYKFKYFGKAGGR